MIVEGVAKQGQYPTTTPTLSYNEEMIPFKNGVIQRHGSKTCRSNDFCSEPSVLITSESSRPPRWGFPCGYERQQLLGSRRDSHVCQSSGE